MRALVYTEQRTLEVMDQPVRPVAAGEVTVRVSAAGHLRVGRAGRGHPQPAPRAAIDHGSRADRRGGGGRKRRGPVLVGQRVAVNPQVPCGVCSACRSGRENVCQDRELVGGTRPGGFAELVSVPARCLHILPDGVDPNLAVLAEPLATCVHGVELLGRVVPRSAVVFGAGTIGVLAAQMLRMIGTEWIAVSDVDPGRRQGAAAVADVAVAPDQLEAAVEGRSGGIEITVDAAGTSAIGRESVRLLQPLGTALWLGMHDLDPRSRPSTSW